MSLRSSCERSGCPPGKRAAGGGGFTRSPGVQVSRPRVLDLAPAYSSLRISGIGFDQGVTKGSWEALYRIGKGKKIKLGESTSTRLSDLSSRALGVVREATGLLYGPMLTLYGNADGAKPYLDRAQSRLRDLLGHNSLQVILDLIAEPPDTQAEQQILQRMATKAIRAVWREVTNVLNVPLQAADVAMVDERRRQSRASLARAPQNGLRESLVSQLTSPLGGQRCGERFTSSLRRPNTGR
jgi:hypothetical protein